MRAGGGMFVGCVVAGSVMLCCQGAKVQGALVRDVAAYAIAVLAVAVILWSGKVIPLSTTYPTIFDNITESCHRLASCGMR